MSCFFSSLPAPSITLIHQYAGDDSLALRATSKGNLECLTPEKALFLATVKAYNLSLANQKMDERALGMCRIYKFLPPSQQKIAMTVITETLMEFDPFSAKTKEYAQKLADTAKEMWVFEPEIANMIGNPLIQARFFLDLFKKGHDVLHQMLGYGEKIDQNEKEFFFSELAITLADIDDEKALEIAEKYLSSWKKGLTLIEIAEKIYPTKPEKGLAIARTAVVAADYLSRNDVYSRSSFLAANSDLDWALETIKKIDDQKKRVQALGRVASLKIFPLDKKVRKLANQEIDSIINEEKKVCPETGKILSSRWWSWGWGENTKLANIIGAFAGIDLDIPWAAYNKMRFREIWMSDYFMTEAVEELAKWSPYMALPAVKCIKGPSTYPMWALETLLKSCVNKPYIDQKTVIESADIAIVWARAYGKQTVVSGLERIPPLVARVDVNKALEVFDCLPGESRHDLHEQAVCLAEIAAVSPHSKALELGRRAISIGRKTNSTFALQKISEIFASIDFEIALESANAYEDDYWMKHEALARLALTTAPKNPGLAYRAAIGITDTRRLEETFTKLPALMSQH